jgi:hypothetical protein
MSFVFSIDSEAHGWSEIKGVFGSQPHFAKPKFGCHNLVGMCLVFATLWLVIFYFQCGPFVIELLLLPKFGFIFLSHTFCGYHTFMPSHTLAWQNVARNQTPPKT